MAVAKLAVGNTESRDALARSVAKGVFSALLNAERDTERESYWRDHAEKLERKFTTDYGQHYAHFTKANPDD